MTKISTLVSKGFSPVTVGNVTKMQKVSKLGKDLTKTELIMPSGVKVTYIDRPKGFTKVVKNLDGTSYCSEFCAERGNKFSFAYAITLKDRLVNRLLGFETKGFKSRVAKILQFQRPSSPGFTHYVF